MVNLYYNFYKSNDSNRQKELDYCFEKNLKNPKIDKIYLIGDNLNHISNKVVNIQLNGLPTFKFVFDLVKKYSKPNDINIITNTDCFLDYIDMDLLKHLGKTDAWCLSRHDITSINPFKSTPKPCPSSSQDCWIFYGSPNINNIDFQFGRAGCDNRIAFELQKAGLKVSNPFHSFHVYHYHTSNVRTFGNSGQRESKRVRGNYLFINPSKLK